MLPINFNYVPIGSFKKEPPEGRKAVCFSLDFSQTLTEAVDIGLTGLILSQLKSIYISNTDPAANVLVQVVGTGQTIQCNATKNIYVPLITAVPARLIFTVNVNTTKPINIIVGNYDFDTIKPNDATLSAQDLTNGVTGTGFIVLSDSPTITTLLTVNGNEHITGNLTVDGTINGTISSVGTFVGEEVPAGVVNGVNPTFTLAHAPIAGSLLLFVNGLKYKRTLAFTLAGNTITFLAGYIPQVGDTLEAYYRY